MKGLKYTVVALFFLTQCCIGIKEKEPSNNLRPVFSFGDDGASLSLNGPIHMVYDEEDLIYVSDLGYSSILKFDLRGEFISNFAEPGEPGEGPGELANQTVIAVDDGWLHVQDNSNMQLVQFDLNSESNEQFIQQTSFAEFDIY